MQDFLPFLDNFMSISLDEMDQVKLMNRVDTKFVFNAAQFADILQALKEAFYVLEVEGYRASPYESIYFDTLDLQLYQQHHNGKTNRFKIRNRQYLSSSLNYLEIKQKNNKSRTIKTRIKVGPEAANDLRTFSSFIESNSPIRVSSLNPVLSIYYSRITLVNKNLTERLTLDTQLRFTANGREIAFPNIIIAELKQDKGKRSFFSALMQQHHIREFSISKYCFGILFLYPDVKRNNFKPKLIQFNKIQKYAV